MSCQATRWQHVHDQGSCAAAESCVHAHPASPALPVRSDQQVENKPSVGDIVMFPLCPQRDSGLESPYGAEAFALLKFTAESGAVDGPGLLEVSIHELSFPQPGCLNKVPPVLPDTMGCGILV
jgi:hypothetical protein